MKLSTLTTLMTASVAFAATARDVPVTLSNVDFTEDMTDESITVTYDLANENNEPVCVQFDMLTNGVSIGAKNIKTVSGDVSSFMTNFVTPGTGKKITWQARTDWKGNVSTQAVACVSAYYTNHLDQVPGIDQIPGIYMIVDLSKGTAATASDPYPVSYTLTPPDPSNDVTCCSNKLWFRRVEANTFKMGSPTSEGGHEDKETQHDVTLTNAFFIGVFPVTRAQYTLVMGSVPNGQTGSSALCPVNMVSYNVVRGATTDNIDWPTTRYNVSSNSFFGVLRSKTGGSLCFDLPTEAEWEYACRAGTKTAWNNGTDYSVDSSGVDENLDKLGWYSKNVTTNTAQVVGQKMPNAWGLYDCHGNVLEWCLDWANGEGLGTEAAIEPVGLSTAVHRALRGGCFDHVAADCRSAARNRFWPANGAGNFGFRPTLIVRP